MEIFYSPAFSPPQQENDIIIEAHAYITYRQVCSGTLRDLNIEIYLDYKCK